MRLPQTLHATTRCASLFGSDPKKTESILANGRGQRPRDSGRGSPLAEGPVSRSRTIFPDRTHLHRSFSRIAARSGEGLEERQRLGPASNLGRGCYGVFFLDPSPKAGKGQMKPRKTRRTFHCFACKRDRPWSQIGGSGTGWFVCRECRDAYVKDRQMDEEAREASLRDG